MKPPAFDYARPGSLAEACKLLADEDAGARAFAGGQSLGPMLNMRLVHIDLIVDIAGLPELGRAERDNGHVTLGACVTHAAIEDGRTPDPTGGLLPAVARGIAYRAVRNRGTIGGSVAHADPAADWLCALPALDAVALIQGPSGAREMPVEELPQGAFESALEPGELLTGVRVPVLSNSARWGFYKFCRRAGEFAEAIATVVWDPEREVCRAAIGALDRPPVVIGDARPLFGGEPGRDLIRSYDAGAAEEALGEAGGRDPLRRQVHLVALRRAVERAST